jgi:membrane protease YdiL (CAAX protease family)
LVGLTLPAAIAVAVTGVSLLLPNVSLTLDPGSSNIIDSLGKILREKQIAEIKRQLQSAPVHPFFLFLFGGMLAGISTNAVAGFGEELGWRGFFLKELAHVGFWKSSWVIGLVWGIWHAPLIVHGYNYPGHPVMGIFMMILFTILFSPLIAYVRLKANSVIAAAIMHGSLNGTAIAPGIVLHGGDCLSVGNLGIAGLAVLAFLNAGLFWWRKREGVSNSPKHRLILL